MVMAIFDGRVHIVEGSEKGFKKPRPIVDKDGESIKISMYWDFDKSKYLHADRSSEGEANHEEHHLTSATTVDWDQDGDLDLLLGAYEGALYLCVNEGTKEEFKFSANNLYVKAGGQHVTLDTGLATPHICDWNGDGNFDILCGGSKGGVFYYENLGHDKETGNPEFAKAIALIDSNIGKETRATPVFPNHGFHIETTDYDQDGDLDLLVGAQTPVKAEHKVLTKAEMNDLAELKKGLKAAQDKLTPMMNGIETEEDYAKLREDENFVNTQKKVTETYQKIAKLEPRAKTKNIVWLFRNKGSQEVTFTSSELR